MARESIGELNIALRASADQLAADISRGIAGSQGAIQARAVALGGVMAAGIVAGLGVVAEGIQRAVSTAFAGLDRIDNLDEAASKIGLSYNALQDLKFAAETTGGSFDGITNAVAKMQATISSGSGDSALTKLGLDAERLRALQPEARVLAVFEALKSVQDVGSKIDLTKQLFGKGGVDILNVVNLGKEGMAAMSREVEGLGGHLSDVQIQMANLANNELDKLNQGWGYMQDQLAVAIAPALIVIGQEIQKAVNQAGGMGPALEPWVSKIVDFGAKILDVAQWVSVLVGYLRTGTAVVSGLAQTVGAVLVGAFVAAKAKGDALWEGLKVGVDLSKNSLTQLAYEIEVAYIKIINSVKAAANAAADAVKSPAASIKKALGIAPDPVDPNWSPYGDQTGMPFDLPTGGSGAPDSSLFGGPAPLPDAPKPIVVDYTGLDKALADYEAASKESWTVVGAAAQENLDKTLAAADEANAKMADAMSGKSWGDNFKKTVDDLKVKASELPKAVESADKVRAAASARSDAKAAADAEATNRADAARRAGVIQAKLTELDAIERATIQSNNRIMEANQRSYDTFRQTSQSAVTNIVSSWVTGTAKISDIVSGWADRMINQFIELALWGNKSAGGSIGGLFGGGPAGGGVGAVVSGVTKLLGFANGGRPPMGRVSVVGERGPELFVPDTAGTIIPNGRASSMGGGQQRGGATTVESPIVINQTFQTGVTRAELAGAMDTMIDQTTGAVLAATVRGGAYRKRLQA